jgi:hypothetical protein
VLGGGPCIAGCLGELFTFVVPSGTTELQHAGWPSCSSRTAANLSAASSRRPRSPRWIEVGERPRQVGDEVAGSCGGEAAVGVVTPDRRVRVWATTWVVAQQRLQLADQRTQLAGGGHPLSHELATALVTTAVASAAAVSARSATPM